MVANSLPPADRGGWIITLAVLVGVGAWTLLIIVLPELRFLEPLPRFRLAIEAAGVLLAFLTAALAYVQFSMTGSRRWKLIAVAFGLLALNRLTFGMLVSPQAIAPQTAVYLWTAARLLVGGLLVAAALGDTEARPVGHPLRVFLRVVLAGVIALVALELLIYLIRDSLPPLFISGSPISPEQVTGALEGLTGAALLLALAGTALYLLAAGALLARKRSPEIVPAWLAPALVLAAFSHIHYALVPTVFTTSYVSTGDLLRLAFSATLLLGLIWEVRRIYLLERARGAETEAAYRAERIRTRELEELDRAKAELFGILTHELLHPVAALRGFAVTLRRYWRDLDDDGRVGILERLETESLRLRDLAEHASSALHLDTDLFSLAVREEDAAQLVQEAAEITDALGGRLKVEVQTGVHGLVLSADRARIMQVFRNLLSNAEKYSEPRTAIELRAEVSNGEVVFSVIDQGPGIPVEEHPRLFQRFSRLATFGREAVRGSGLGLYISRRIVEAHGGRIWVESESGRGSVFRFSLPANG